MGSRRLIVLALVAVLAIGAVACGDDDDESGSDPTPTAEAVAPPPETAFDNLTKALEGQGLVVTRLPEGSLDGAEAGVSVSGGRSGSARSFSSEAKADAYAGDVGKDGQETAIVGTVVFQADSKDDADFFADAYEG